MRPDETERGRSWERVVGTAQQQINISNGLKIVFQRIYCGGSVGGGQAATTPDTKNRWREL